ncbi:MAG: glycosyltransferase family 2 protein [Methylomonas sp.]|jgi:glycosyltransferase involved in cell wall biosynthesis|uniref:glycosyltransferase family 2 protein n=1 Tax=Methylomonas sp. TaxID=418 RepID=UPI0025D8AD95|nr:glycosyltransferase family 2 protein [Methylomonas sp.]MCK9607108.1 glycosyltransferase family 2 protein [Methylomonas sp.]
MTESLPTNRPTTAAKLSAYIIAYNEADKIADAIQSVQWADEVLVLDSNSTDNTESIAIKLGATVKQIPFSTFGKLRNDAIASCTHDWIFSLDADERCTPEAREEILTILTTPTADAYYVPRRNWFMGRWINHCGWYPDYRQPQLFRKQALVFDDAAEVHEGYKVNGKVGYFKSSIIQIPFQNLEQLLHKMQRYSTLGARKLERSGKPVTMGTALGHGLWAFIRIYVLKLGFLDGWAGFVLAFGNFEGTFYRYAKAATAKQSWKPDSLPNIETHARK